MTRRDEARFYLLGNRSSPSGSDGSAGRMERGEAPAHAGLQGPELVGNRGGRFWKGCSASIRRPDVHKVRHGHQRALNNAVDLLSHRTKVEVSNTSAKINVPAPQIGSPQPRSAGDAVSLE